MYSTCLFCNSDLGRNQAIEHFPVGLRLAYDAAKGRLWVVCRRCERWNLSPLEERWEAIDECERRYGATRLRVSTDNIGLARLREGLELVRIGRPQRPEFAAWRYGDQFGRRRRRHLIYSTAGAVAVAGIVIAGPATGFIAGGSWGLWQAANALRELYDARRVRVRLKLPGLDEPAIIRKRHLREARLVSASDDVGTWQLHVAHERTTEPPSWPQSLRTLTSPSAHAATRELTVLSGDDALRAAGQLLPKLNAAGARASQVQSAVRLIEETGDPVDLFAKQAERGRPTPLRPRTGPGLVIGELPTEVRLALEMAAHEEAERRALEGELALLEEAWRDAEEIAAIADDMFLPEGTDDRLEVLRRRGAGSE